MTETISEGDPDKMSYVVDQKNIVQTKVTEMLQKEFLYNIKMCFYSIKINFYTIKYIYWIENQKWQRSDVV